jgi:DNA repair ATPase RecN
MIVVNTIANGPKNRNMFANMNATRKIANAKRAKAIINATAVVANTMSRIVNFMLIQWQNHHVDRAAVKNATFRNRPDRRFGPTFCSSKPLSRRSLLEL